MKNITYYYIMSFPTTTDAMYAEKHTKEHFQIAVMPTPREISSGCGLSLRFMEPDENAIIEFCKTNPLNGTLYKMYTHKIDGRHPIEQVLCC